uniref:Uncharacterized protein n=1 Tax=Ursus maritimus TaxID=29073 RepID=A0A452TJ26_URSMA
MFVSSKDPLGLLGSPPRLCPCRNCSLLLIVSQGDVEAGKVTEQAQCLPQAGSAAWYPGLGAQAQQEACKGPSADSFLCPPPQEYEPTIFYPTRSLDLLHRDLTTQCEKMDIPFLSYLPTEVQLINDAYGLVVDAVLGPGVQP